MPRKPAHQIQQTLAKRSHAIEESEGIRQQPGTPRTLRVGDGVKTLRRLVARLDRLCKTGQEPGRRRRISIDDNQGVIGSQLPCSPELLDQKINGMALAFFGQIMTFDNRGAFPAGHQGRLVRAVVGNDKNLEQIGGIIESQATA